MMIDEDDISGDVKDRWRQVDDETTEMTEVELEGLLLD